MTRSRVESVMLLVIRSFPFLLTLRLASPLEGSIRAPPSVDGNRTTRAGRATHGVFRRLAAR